MPEFDVAVFAGDVHKPMTAALEWFVRQREAGPLRDRDIVYVAGNHEFYKTEMKGALAAGSELADKVGIHLLHRRTVAIGQVRFIGCTLWTDYRLLGTPSPSMAWAGQVNHHRLIRYQEEGGRYGRFMPSHALAEHRLDLAFIRNELAKPHDGSTVVVTHHAPHPQSVLFTRQRSGTDRIRLGLRSLPPAHLPVRDRYFRIMSGEAASPPEKDACSSP